MFRSWRMIKLAAVAERTCCLTKEFHSRQLRVNVTLVELYVARLDRLWLSVIAFISTLKRPVPVFYGSTGRAYVGRMFVGHPSIKHSAGLHMQVANGRPQSRRDTDGMAAETSERAQNGVGKAKTRYQRSASSPQLSVIPDVESAGLRGPRVKRPAQPCKLSTRAQNVLKILSVELTGEEAPRGMWVPSDFLLQRLTYHHLSTARNCGPQTATEIIRWAQARGTIIRRPPHAGKSLSAMWQDTIAKISAGDISRKEIAEALEKSARRGNTRIPVAFQRVLLRLVGSPNG